MHLSHKQDPIPGNQDKDCPSKIETPEICPVMSGSQHFFQSTDPLLSFHITC